MTKEELINYLQSNGYNEYAPKRFSKKEKEGIEIVELHNNYVIITENKQTKLRKYEEVKTIEL